MTPKSPTSRPISMPGKIIMNETEIALRAELKRAVRPRIASTIVLLQGPKANPRILMGQRSSRHDFMPSVYVFPGGRVDRADSYAPASGELSARTKTILEAAYAPRKAKAVALAAIRETFEETNLVLGTPHANIRNMKHKGWQGLHDTGRIADLSGIEVFGRAVTPPHRHKRFDTWFFLKHIEGELPAIADSTELLNVGWFTFDQIDTLELQRATTMMLQVLKQYLSHDTAPRRIFYSHMVRGTYTYSKFPSLNAP